jgi:hypothetical protein
MVDKHPMDSSRGARGGQELEVIVRCATVTVAVYRLHRGSRGRRSAATRGQSLPYNRAEGRAWRSDRQNHRRFRQLPVSTRLLVYTPPHGGHGLPFVGRETAPDDSHFTLFSLTRAPPPILLLACVLLSCPYVYR